MQNTDDSRHCDSTPPHACEDKASKDRQDELLLDAIRDGDEASFAELVRRYERSMIRLARAYVGDSATAEEVVQETWLAVVKGLGEFKHRSSFKTWLFSILTNQARKRAAKPEEWSREGGSSYNNFSLDKRAAAECPLQVDDVHLPEGHRA